MNFLFMTDEPENEVLVAPGDIPCYGVLGGDDSNFIERLAKRIACAKFGTEYHRYTDLNCTGVNPWKRCDAKTDDFRSNLNYCCTTYDEGSRNGRYDGVFVLMKTEEDAEEYARRYAERVKGLGCSHPYVLVFNAVIPKGTKYACGECDYGRRFQCYGTKSVTYTRPCKRWKGYLLASGGYKKPRKSFGELFNIIYYTLRAKKRDNI